IWIPAQTTVPPFETARSATGTSAPIGAKMIAASSGSGGSWSDPPAHSAPQSSANVRPSTSPGRVNANTLRPWYLATWAMMCAAAGPARLQCSAARPRLGHAADDLVPRDQRQFRMREFAVHDVQVGPAHGAGAHPQAHLVGPRPRRLDLRGAQRAPRGVQQHGAHHFAGVNRAATKSRTLAASFTVRSTQVMEPTSGALLSGRMISPAHGRSFW